MRPCTLRELIVAVGSRPAVEVRPDVVFTGVSTDSRSLRPGDVFWALPGALCDGHAFTSTALERGAVACVVQHDRRPAGQPVVAVADTGRALAEFSRWYRSTLDALVIGVTGSVGKTTTRALLHAVLSSQFPGVQSPHNFNNHIGVPLSLLQIDPAHEFAVLELAASRPGEIATLAELAAPEAAVVTAVAPAHLEYFGSIEAIAQTKGELVEAVPAGGFVVLNGDDPRVREMARRTRARVITVGQQSHNDLVACDVSQVGDQLGFTVGVHRFLLRAIGRHHLTAALCGVAAAREIGISDADIAAGLLRFSAQPGRCQPVQIGGCTVIHDAYNASPASLQAALDVLSEWPGAGQKILVLGDMLELGPEAHQWHEQLGQEIGRRRFSRLATFGALAAVAARGARRAGMDASCIGECQDLATLNCLLDCWVEPGDVVLLKGSRGLRLERVLADWEQRLAAQAQPGQERRAA